MFARYHVHKGERIEATLQKLDIVDDYEMIIEICMLAGTHYFNAALHAADISHQMQDQAHTFRPPLEYLRKPVGPEIMGGAKPLAYIESTRIDHVRGAAAYDRALVERCIKSLAEAKEAFLAIVGSAKDKAVWELE